MDICLIPLSPPQWVHIAMPNKFFEYSACGKAILSTPIPNIMELGGENLFIYRDMREFVEVVKRIMDDPRAYPVEVGGHSWKNKAEEMERVLDEVVSRR